MTEFKFIASQQDRGGVSWRVAGLRGLPIVVKPILKIPCLFKLKISLSLKLLVSYVSIGIEVCSIFQQGDIGESMSNQSL